MWAELVWAQQKVAQEGDNLHVQGFMETPFNVTLRHERLCVVRHTLTEVDAEFSF